MKKLILTLAMLILCTTQPVFAWSSHILLTHAALKNMPQISQEPIIPAETLNSFVSAEAAGLVPLLKGIDEWPNQENISEGVKIQLKTYPPLPANLVFKGNEDATRPLLQQFIERARINPDALSYQVLFVEYVPGEIHRINNPMQNEEVILPRSLNETHVANPPFEKVYPGETVSALEIITSAVDEPDFGMDIQLWEDSGTTFGKKYHLGNQPFGNKTVAISSQAPFHMGLYYESEGIYSLTALQGFNIYHCYPEYRIHYFLTLSRYAFKTGHPYWGYRFLGWAMHYLQDLSQPYHTSSMLSISAIVKMKMGIGESPQDFLQLLTNKHFSLENYQYGLMKNEFLVNPMMSEFIQRLSDTSDDARYPLYSDLYPREIAAALSHVEVNQLDQLMIAAFPSKYVSDPTYLFGKTEPDLYAEVKQDEMQLFNLELMKLFGQVGVNTRQIVRYALAK